MEEIYKKLADKHGLTEDTIKQIHLDFWKGVKKVVQEDTAKDILISGFGTLYFDKKNLHAATNEVRDKIEWNEIFLKKGGDWMKYLYTWRGLNQKKNHFDKLWKSIEKRENRKKGERGL